MRRSAALVPVLLLALAPAAAADAPECGGTEHYTDTLAVSLSAPPATVRAGSQATVAVTVTRARVPAAGATVYLRLEQAGRQDETSVAGRTGADGRVVVKASVLQQARGPLHVTVDAYKKLATLPCYGTVVERGTAASDWGRAVG